MSLVVHKLVLSPGGATATTAQPPTAHHVTLSAYTHARSNATDSMGRVLDGPPSGSMSTPPASSSPYSSSSNSSSSSKHSSTYNLPFVLQDHNYGAPPPPTPPHSPPPLPSTSTSSSTSHPLSNTSSSSGSTYQHHHHFQQQHQHQHHQQQHQYHHHHHQTYQSAAMAPSSSTSSSPSSSSSFTSHHHTSSSSATPHHQQHHHLHHPATTSSATITAPHHHHHHLHHQHHHHPTTTANPHHHHHHQQQQHHHHQHQQHHSSTTTSTTSHFQSKHHNFLQHPSPSPRLGSSSSSSSSTTPSSTTSSSTSNTPSSATSFSSPSLSVGGVMAHHPLTNMPPHRQQFMPHPKSSIIFPSPHIPPPPVELSPHHPHHHQPPPSSSSGPPQPVLPSTETDDDSRLSDRSSSVGPSGEETETAPEGEGDDLPADDSITRCVCDFSHDDGYMIQCDRCFVWQHVDCMEIDRDNIPDEYLCEACDPRPIDRFKARALQIRRRQEIKAHLARLSSSDSEDNIPMSTKSRGSLNKVQERKVVKKKKVKQIKDMKNGRKSGGGGGGGGGASGSLSLLKKSGGGSNTTTTSCNNSLLPGQEDKDRRMLVKRRRKSNSLSGGEGVSDDSSGGPVERLRAWVEGYEAAVTNHYSPELRARVHAARINGVSPDLRASTQGAVLGHRCRVANNPRPLFDVFDSKILVAATRLSPNTAITEFQGKYLLASQWNAQQPVSSQPYMPYVLQYHMPKEGLTVCVDARTYGNDARFTRHSCMPNAEVRHVVERGSLHLYIVATQEIEEGEEVTLALETANSTLELFCCLAEEHDCRAPPGPRPEQTTPAPALTHKKNGLIVGNKKALKKQQLQLQLRTSKRTASDTRSVELATTNPVTPSTPVTTVKQRRASGCGKSPVKSPSTASLSSSPEEVSKDISSNNPGSSTLSTATGTVTTAPDTPRSTLDKQQQQKMTREERKIAAYMKAFERMEKAAQRRQEMEKKKEEDKGKEVREPKEKEKKRCDGDEEDWEKTSSADECVRSMGGTDRCRRKGKKGRGKGSPQKRSNHRADSAASDLTGDESSCASVGLMSPSGGATMESIALNFSSPPQGNPNAMGFRFPKTKKALMNEWLNENVDPVVPAGSVVGTDLPSGVPPCYMRSPAMPFRRSSLNQTTGTGALPVQDMSGGSAKKRWLRQAISEETETPQFNGLCPSPNSRPDSPTGGGDYITPLKKRRLARESMSSELSSTPPSTPVHSTSLEEDKMVEEMEAELAEEDSHKIKSNCRYSEGHHPSSPSNQDDTTCIGFLRSTADSNSNSGRMKRGVVQEDEEEEDEEEEEDLVIDEGGSFFDQGSGAVNFSKVAACGRLSQGQAEEQCKEEQVKGRAVTRGKSLRGKKVCYELQEEEEEEEEVDENEKEEKEDSKLGEREDSGAKEKQQGMGTTRKESAKTKRRQNAVKKSVRCQQQAPKRGKKQQGGSMKKGKQEVKAKVDAKRRKTVKRGKGEVPVLKEEDAPAEDEKERELDEEKEVKEEKPTVKEEEKPELVDSMLQKIKEEPSHLKIKTEAAETTTETDCKVEFESESQEKQVKVETTLKEEEESEKKIPEIKSEPDLSERKDNIEPHQDAETTLENNAENSDPTKEKENVDSVEDAEPVDKVVNTDEDNSLQKVEVNEEKNTQTPDTDKVEGTDGKQSSEDNQKPLQLTNAIPEASQKEVKEVISRNINTVEESVTSDNQEQTKKTVKKKAPEKVNKKVKKPRRQFKKSKEPKQKRKGVKEALEIQLGKEDASLKETITQKAETDLEEEINARQKEPVLEQKDIEEQNLPQECSKSPSSHVSKKRMDDEDDIQEPVDEKESKDNTKERPKTPTEEEVDETTLQAKSDDSSTITLETKLDTPVKAEEHPMELSRKPPTPPTLFPPLPWQTNPETFSDADSLRPKTPENSSYLGLRGPRTPEGPAPTSPSDPAMSPPSCSPRSPLTSAGDSEIKGQEKRVKEDTTEGNWRPRARGPCTPPTPPPQEATQEEEQQQQQEGGEESNSSPSHQHTPSNPESTQTRPAPVKKKLSILEYRKRKSVGGEAGPLDSSPPPCQPPNRTASGDSSKSTHESLVRGESHSPSQSSPPGLTGGSGEDGDSSPDLPLSPIGPIILPPSPISFDTRSTAEETKKDGETYRGNVMGTGSNNDLSRHSIVNKIISSSNSISNISNTSSSSSSSINSSIGAVTESLTTTNTTTTPVTTTTTTHTLHPISGGNTQDVKWNAAPTLLERQRENLTARLRREFGLCVADDDDDKSSVRLGCSGVLSRPSPPMLPATAPLSTTSSPLSPRVRKPPSLAVGPPSCVPYVAEGDERSHRRHKNLPPPPLPPPPPPPLPPSAPPKNSIFQGREVTVQKVAGTVVKASVTGTVQPTGVTAGGSAVVSGPQRLIGSAGLFPGPAPTPSTPLASPSVRGGSSSQGTAPASPGIPNVLPGGVPRPCPVPPPIGVPPVPAPPGLAVLPAVAHGLPGLPPSKQPGPCITPALTAPQQNPEYPGRSFPRSQFSSTGMASLTSPMSLYSAARLGPPPPPPLPPQTDPAGPGLRGPSPPGHSDPARVGGEGGTSYSGQDCPAPGTRGS